MKVRKKTMILISQIYFSIPGIWKLYKQLSWYFPLDVTENEIHVLQTSGSFIILDEIQAVLKILESY
jgi:hypothetical protein